MGTGDYKAAGKTTSCSRNTNSAVAVWQVSGTQILASNSLGNPDPTWHV